MTKPSFYDYGTYDESAYPHLWSGIVGAWCPSLGNTGLRLHDFSKNTNWGELRNTSLATVWQLSNQQLSINTDGSDDAIDCGNILNNVFTGTDATFSISAWINVRVNQSQHIISKNQTTPTAGRQFFIQANDTGLDFSWSGSLSIGSSRVIRHSRTFTTSGWMHIGVDFDAKIASSDQKAKLYVNGVAVSYTVVASSGTPVSIQAGDARLSLSGNVRSDGSIANPYGGNIDDVKVYNRLRTANEWAEEYALGRAGIYKSRRHLRNLPIEQEVVAGNKIWIKQSGVWKEATPWIKVSGVWKTASPKINISGSWL